MCLKDFVIHKPTCPRQERSQDIDSHLGMKYLTCISWQAMQCHISGYVNCVKLHNKRLDIFLYISIRKISAHCWLHLTMFLYRISNEIISLNLISSTFSPTFPFCVDNRHIYLRPLIYTKKYSPGIAEIQIFSSLKQSSPASFRLHSALRAEEEETSLPSGRIWSQEAGPGGEEVGARGGKRRGEEGGRRGEAEKLGSAGESSVTTS